MASTATAAAVRWSESIDRQEASAPTLRVFADANGLNRNTLAWWRWELGRTGAHSRRQDTRSRHFVELVVTEPETAPMPAPVVIALEGLTARLVVGEHTDLVLVRRVLEALC